MYEEKKKKKTNKNLEAIQFSYKNECDNPAERTNVTSVGSPRIHSAATKAFQKIIIIMNR
jgi:hypothetical protein